ncbi:MAG: hypothetical protein DCF30_11770 [Hyphomicrobiales bacterium]|nr:MAG: hypothetical protein DCF30_11770 [Hyphomicrobiales bacterium]
MSFPAWLTDGVAALKAYAHHPDPRVAMANFFALLVASNQPFYPLYLYWTVGPEIGPSVWTFLSTPFFLAVPALARRNALAGRALLPIAGIANTLLSAKVFGVASGVEIFLVPCAVLALLIFRPHERWIAAFPLAGFCFLAYLLFHDAYGAPFHLYSEAEYAALLRLNMLSAGGLTAFTALSVSTLLADAEAEAASAKAPGGGVTRH